VVKLWNLVFPDDPPWNEPNAVIDRKLTAQPHLFLVCAFDGMIIGTTIAGFDGFRGWIHHLAVHPDHAKKGIATLLMQSAEEGLAILGCPKINLQVRSDNIDVIAFYEKLGYLVENRISLAKNLGNVR